MLANPASLPTTSAGDNRKCRVMSDARGTEKQSQERVAELVAAAWEAVEQSRTGCACKVVTGMQCFRSADNGTLVRETMDHCVSISSALPATIRHCKRPSCHPSTTDLLKNTTSGLRVAGRCCRLARVKNRGEYKLRTSK